MLIANAKPRGFYISCLIGLIFILMTGIAVGSPSPDVVPVEDTEDATETIETDCASLDVYNTSKMSNYQRSFTNALWDGSLMVGYIQDNDTNVYRDCLGFTRFSNVSDIRNDTGRKLFYTESDDPNLWAQWERRVEAVHLEARRQDHCAGCIFVLS